MLAQTHLKLANFPAQRAAWRALRCRGSAERDVSLCAATTKVFCRAAAQRCTTPGPTMGMALKHDGQRLEESPRVAGDGWARRRPGRPPADGCRRNWAVPAPPAPKMICGTPVFLAGADLLSNRMGESVSTTPASTRFQDLPATGRRSAAYRHEPIRARTRRRFGFDFSRSLSKPVIPRFRDALTNAWMCATSSGWRSSGAYCITRDRGHRKDD
jgi:hypothetical protein